MSLGGKEKLSEMETTATMITAIATSVSAIVAMVVVVVTRLQNRKQDEKDCSDRVERMLEKTRTNTQILSFFNKIDYGETWYDDSFHNSEFEKAADTALMTYEYILELKEKGMINEEEFKDFKYEIDKIMKNKDTHSYFKFLYHYTKREGLQFKYGRLLKYGVDNQFINSSLVD